MTPSRALLSLFTLAAVSSFAAPTMNAFNEATPQSTCVMCFYERVVGVVVQDNGAGQAGVPVTFSSSGPALAIPGVGTGPWTVTTDTFGLASLPYPGIAVVEAGAFTIVATSPAVPNSVSFELAGAGGPPARVDKGSTDPAAMVGTMFAEHFIANVYDANNQQLANAVVAFTVIEGSGASLTFHQGPGQSGLAYGPFVIGPVAYARASAFGQAFAPNMVANGVTGRGEVRATTLNGVSPAFPHFFYNSSASAASLDLLPGTSPQSAHVGAFFPVVFGATVRDAVGQPVKDAAVLFRLTSDLNTQGYGYFVTEPSSTSEWIAYTGPDGLARAPTWMVVTKAGPFDLKVSVPGATTVPLALTGLAGGVESLDIVAGNDQRAIVNTTYPLPWTFRAKGGDGLPIPHAAIGIFVETRPGFPSGSFAGLTRFYMMADENGVATTPRFTANAVVGNYVGLAWASGVSSSPSRLVDYTNLTATLHVAHLDAQPPYNAPVGGATWAPYRAIVRNALEQPVQGVAYTFHVDPSCGRFLGQASFTGTTDADGVAASPLLEAVGPSLDCRTQLVLEGASNSLSFTMHTFLPSSVVINTYPLSMLVPTNTVQYFGGTLFADGLDVYLPTTVSITADHNGASASMQSLAQAVGNAVTNGTILTNAKAGSYQIVIRAGPASAVIPVTQKVGRIN